MVQRDYVIIQKFMKQIGRIFDAPILVEGITWFPLVQILTWGIMSWMAGHRNDHLSRFNRSVIGAVNMSVALGSEWGHNLAHAFTAYLMRKPADGIKIIAGMPRLFYQDVNDCTVTPKQHIIRAAGGSVFNLSLLLVAFLSRKFAGANLIRREALKVAISVNAFIGLVGLLPIPGIDGGVIVKWWLVHRGRNPGQADDVIRKINGIMGCLMGVASAVAAKQRAWFLSVILALFGSTSLGVAGGIIKEQTDQVMKNMECNYG